MSMNVFALSVPHPTSQGVARIFKSWWNAYWTRKAQRATVFMLQSLDDRSLQDIGLSRSEITSVVYGKLGERQLRYERQAH